MNKKLLLLTTFLCMWFATFSQTKQVSGKIIDSLDKSPLAGVSIKVLGQNIGVASDANGAFQLNVPNNATQLVISLVGYDEKTITISGQAINVSLSSSNTNLNQVVVVGYGSQKKKDLTGAIATISSEDIVGRQTVQVSESLQGAIAGVTVTRSSSAPGSGSTVRVRGVTTLNNNNALVVVDGIPVSSMDLVNPNDIESLSVLKDASSASIYGSRGAAGVILITTKRGSTGASSLEYNFEYALQKPTALPKYVDAPNYMRYFNEQATNDGASTGPYANDFIVNFEANRAATPDKFPFANTDWQDLILTNKYAPREQHDLVFTSGTDKLKTKVSLGYQNIGAFYNNYNYERYQFRVNNDIKINEKLSANVDVALRRLNNLSPVANPFSGATPIYEARVLPPIYAAYYSNGNYSIAKDGRNPLAQLNEGGTTTGNSNQLQGRMSLNYKPVNGLTLTGTLAPTFDFDKSKAFSKKITYTLADGSPTTLSNTALTTLSESRSENYQLTSQFLANYTKVFAGKHNFGALLGYEGVYNNGESLGASRSGFVLTDFPYLNAGSQLLRDNSGDAFETNLRSFFGRLTYDYMGKYYAQANLRYDQSSRFGPAYRDAYFPSFSAGWNISEENFMKNIKWIDFLKIRGSYGEVGNERIGNYPYQASIDLSTALFYQNGVVVPLNGGAQTVYAVSNISWETTKSTDVGIDGAFLNNRLSVTADYYKKRTTDILLNLDIPINLGFERPSQNAGTLEVKGWEFATNWKDKVGKLTYGIGFNISDEKSKILDMRGTQILGDQSIFEGSQFNEWYGYKSTGIYQTVAQATSAVRTSSAVTAGDLGYVDVDGNGIINANDRVLLGGSLPRYQYGGNINLAYGGFDFAMSFQGVGKKLSRLNSEIVRPFLEQFGNFPELLVGNFYSKTNTPEQNLAAQYPRLTNTVSSNNYSLSDFWLIDGSYFRVKNATLGYTLNKQDFLSKIGISSLRIYIAANDFLTSSKYPKYADPESGNASYPIVTTFLGGLNVKF